MKNCPEFYNGKTGRRLIERVNDHNGKDINIHMFKHLIEANHPTVTLDNFIVLNSGYHKCFIKHNRPSLNKQGTPIPLS